MVELGLFFLVGGVPIFFFLRRVRALRLSRGYALVLTGAIVVGLWLLIVLIVDLGRF
jgi:hypothetical protein